MQKFVTSTDPIILFKKTQRNPHQTDSSLRGNYSSEGGLTREPRFYGNGIGPSKSTRRCARGAHGGQAPAPSQGDTGPRRKAPGPAGCARRAVTLSPPGEPGANPAPAAPGGHPSVAQPQAAFSPGEQRSEGAVSSAGCLLIPSRAGDAVSDVKGAVKWASGRFPGSFWR